MGFSLINGNYFAFQDTDLRINGLQFVGFKGLNYSDNLHRDLVRGAQRVPLGVTAGKYEAKGDFELYLPQASFLLGVLGPAWRQVPLVISITYGPVLGSIPPIVNDIIPQAYITEVGAAQSEGDAPLARKFSLVIPGQILWNGVPSIIEVGSIGAVG